MKKLLLMTGLAAALLQAPLPLQAAEADKGAGANKRVYPISPMLKPVELQVRDAKPDEFLIELGRAANINIVADVTQLPLDSPPITLQRKGAVGLMASHLVNTRKMMFDDLDEGTVVFWPAPDVTALARQIREEQAKASQSIPWSIEEEKRRLQRRVQESEEGSKRLQEYLRQNHQWNGRWEDVDITVPLEDLPKDLRAQVQREMEIQMGYIRLDDLHQRRSRDEFWDQTRLYLEVMPPWGGTEPEPHLMIWDIIQTPYPGYGGMNINLGSLNKRVPQ